MRRPRHRASRHPLRAALLLALLGVVLILMARAHHLATQPAPGLTGDPAGSSRVHTGVGPVIRCGDHGLVVSVTPDTPQNRSDAEQLCQAATGGQ